MEQQGTKKKTSPWVWVAAGCGGAVLLGVLVVAVLGFSLFRWGKSVERELKDPATRTAKVQKILGVEQLPAGYYAAMGVEVPFLMRMAMLSDHEVELGNGKPDREMFGERGFLYFETQQFKRDHRAEDFVAGRASLDELLQGQNVNLDVESGEQLAEGAFDVAGGKARFVARRGAVSMSGSRQDESVSGFVIVDCSGDQRFRFAILFGPDPSPTTPAAELDKTGTPADPALLEAFVGQFKLCPT
jgi:hypothetical protein